MVLLSIDTSTKACSVALSEDGLCSAGMRYGDCPSHTSTLPKQVEYILTQAANQQLQIDGVAVSAGPGSYTGLRIGTSFAKGYCYGRSIPLYPVPTLMILAAMFKQRHKDLYGQEDILLCPMLDARRMEVYTTIYDKQFQTLLPTQAKVIDSDEWLAPFADKQIYFFGNGAMKCQSVLNKPNYHFIDAIAPDAMYMGQLVEDACLTHIQPIDGKEIAYYEPNYLKDFVAAPAHIKGLN